MISDLKITTEQRQTKVPVTVFHMRGWLDAQGEAQFLEAARLAYDEGERYLLVNMSDHDTLTSAGMRAIQKVYKMFTPHEDQFKVAHLKLCKAPPQIYTFWVSPVFCRTSPCMKPGSVMAVTPCYRVGP